MLLRSCRALVFVLVAWVAVSAQAPTPRATAPAAPVHIYAADVLEVVDGDSFHVRADLGLETERRLEIRVFGLFAPEKHTIEGKAVRAAAVALLAEHGHRVLFITRKVGAAGRDDKSFARYVATVWLPDGRLYGDALRQRITWTDNGIGGKP
jgi:endonuclease YncB( thermonuclease family)